MAHRDPAARLARRFPLLCVAPPVERRPIVRSALCNPVCVLLLLACVAGVIPAYLDLMFRLLDLNGEDVLVVLVCKLAGVVVAAVWGMTWFFSRVVLPPFIRRELRRRGYTV